MTPSLPELADEFARAFPPPPAAEAEAAAPVVAPATEPGDPAVPGPAPARVNGVQSIDYPTRGYHLEARVDPRQVVPAATLLDRHGFALDTISGIDWIAEGMMEIVYDYFHPQANLRVAVRTRVPRDNPELPTILHVFPGANWHERETHDFFGIRFLGHPELTPLLLPEDATYHPLRKDFTA